MKNSVQKRLSLVSAISLIGASASFSAEIIPITSFDPTTFFDTAIAGIDFNDGTSTNYPDPNQPGFVDIPASNSKSYNVSTNGITFDLQIRNANLGNQNRNRNNAAAGALVTDFEQWYGRHAETGIEVEGTLTLSGLAPNTDYQVSVFTMNLGAGNVTTLFYDGADSDAPLITSYTTSGNPNNPAAWSPGITLQFNSGASGEIVLTAQASEYVSGENFESRLGICGVSVVSLGPPPFEGDLEITSIEVDPITDLATLAFTGSPSTPYACLSSSDLVDFSTNETAISGSLTTDESGNGSVVVSATEGKKFFRLEPLAVP